MTEGRHDRDFEDILRRVSQPARLIGSEFGTGPGFSEDRRALRVVLGFPDTYEIGISNQAIQILLHLARNVADVEVERAYLPWVDVIGEMRQAGVPLLTMETWSPVADTDLVAVTLQHEFNYTNVLEMLDLAGIPLRADQRADHHPLLLGGGPAAANFLPVAPFFDAIAVGDGEEVFLEIVATLAEAKRDGASRAEAKARLSRIPGIYAVGLSTGVARRVVRRLEGAAYPTTCLVPLTAGVHDRSWVEIMRGCTRGCRFCQAGMWYRPVRERSEEEVMRMATAQLAATGHQELALASLSTTDYSALEGLLRRLVVEQPEVRLSLPSLRVDSAAVRLAHLASPTGPSLTLAPEAGSQRMRDVINKNITDEDVLTAAEEAFRCGCTTLKLYFVIGFPLEEDDDVSAIADLCLRVRDLGRRTLGPRASRLRLNISVNNFVPKPFTPFQWAGMADRATLRRRQDVLRAALRRPGTNLALHDVDKSHLEAALARGGEGMAGVMEEAWRRGARFDSWTEQFSGAAWTGALSAAGLSAEALATRNIPRDEALPWDVIGGCVSKDFLWTEWERAALGRTTPDCRWEHCSDCGVCQSGLANDLAPVTPARTADPQRPLGPAAGVDSPDAGSSRGPLRGSRSYLLTFRVSGRVRFVGHLDKTELFRRAVRRAGGRLDLSAGMRPKPLLTLVLPLAVGMEGERELCEFSLAEEPPVDFAERLRHALPVGMDVVGLESYEGGRSAAARVVAGRYELEVEAAGPGLPLAEVAERFRTAPSLVMEDKRGERVRSIDVKAYVDEVDVESLGDAIYRLRLRVRTTPQGSVRVQKVVEALGVLGAPSLDLRSSKRVGLELR